MLRMKTRPQQLNLQMNSLLLIFFKFGNILLTDELIIAKPWDDDEMIEQELGGVEGK